MRLLHRRHGTEHHQRRFYAQLIALALLVAYAVAFILQNSTSVRIGFVFAHARVSLIWLILLSIAVGLLAGLLLPRLERRWSRRTRKRAQPGDAV